MHPDCDRRPFQQPSRRLDGVRRPSLRLSLRPSGRQDAHGMGPRFNLNSCAANMIAESINEKMRRISVSKTKKENCFDWTMIPSDHLSVHAFPFLVEMRIDSIRLSRTSCQVTRNITASQVSGFSQQQNPLQATPAACITSPKLKVAA